MSERDLVEWYLAMKKPKLTKIMVAGKPFYISKVIPAGQEQDVGRPRSTTQGAGNGN